MIKAIIFDIHKMVSDVHAQQAVNSEKILHIDKDLAEVKKEVGKHKTFVTQAKVVVSILLSITGISAAINYVSKYL